MFKKSSTVTQLPDGCGEFPCERTCFTCKVYDLCKTRYMERIIALRKDAGLETRWEEEKLRKRRGES